MRTHHRDTFQMTMTAMFIALISVSILLLRVPVPFTQGYVHLGDAVIFLGILALGWKRGAVAAGLGGMFGDLLGGFAVWAPWSLAIKGLMALLIGLVLQKLVGPRAASRERFYAAELAAMVLAGAFETAAYFLAEGVMYGSWAVAALGIPWNIGQFVMGMAAAAAIGTALQRTPARRYFAYRQAVTRI